jgi:biopolymer transport protein ExbD
MQPRLKQHTHADIDMAPMIDMVFQLLIFFMCAATMSQVDFTPAVTLPVAEKAKIPEENELANRGTINILPPDTEHADYYVAVSGQAVDQKELLKLMEARRAENPEIKLYLRAHKDVPFKHVKHVLRACAEAGISDIIFASFQSAQDGA